MTLKCLINTFPLIWKQLQNNDEGKDAKQHQIIALIDGVEKLVPEKTKCTREHERKIKEELTQFSNYNSVCTHPVKSTSRHSEAATHAVPILDKSTKTRGENLKRWMNMK